MKTILYAAFPGTGKTYICEKTDISSIEIEYWIYKDRPAPDALIKHEYIKDAKEAYGKVDYIFISTDPEGIKVLYEAGFDITLVYPKNELRSEYLDRYITRDSPHEFIGAFMKYWNTWLEELKKITYCKHIVLESGQYLQDIL